MILIHYSNIIFKLCCDKIKNTGTTTLLFSDYWDHLIFGQNGNATMSTVANPACDHITQQTNKHRLAWQVNIYLKLMRTHKFVYHTPECGRFYRAGCKAGAMQRKKKILMPNWSPNGGNSLRNDSLEIK